MNHCQSDNIEKKSNSLCKIELEVNRELYYFYLDSFTILTTSANSLISPIHARMPVILPTEAQTDWLSGSELEPLLSPYPAENMTTYPLDPYVNDARHDDLKCLSPAERNAQADFFSSS